MALLDHGLHHSHPTPGHHNTGDGDSDGDGDGDGDGAEDGEDHDEVQAATLGGDVAPLLTSGASSSGPAPSHQSPAHHRFSSPRQAPLAPLHHLPGPRVPSTPASRSLPPADHLADALCTSKTALTTALSQAQAAVLLDTSLQIPQAITAYTRAVLLLEQVLRQINEMGRERERKELESLLSDQARDRLWASRLFKKLASSHLSEHERDQIHLSINRRECEWQERRWRMDKRKKSRLDEEDRLVGIHNTYASRIRELQAELAGANDDPYLRLNSAGSADSSGCQDHRPVSPSSSEPPGQLCSSSTAPHDLHYPNHHRSDLSTSTWLESPSSPLDSQFHLPCRPAPPPCQSFYACPSLAHDRFAIPLPSPKLSSPRLMMMSSAIEPDPRPGAERKSFGSDSTARDLTSTGPIPCTEFASSFTSVPALSSLTQPYSQCGSDTSSSNNLADSFRQRSSSSISGASLSRFGRVKSNDSMATSIRTSVSSTTAHKSESSFVPPIPPTPSQHSDQDHHTPQPLGGGHCRRRESFVTPTVHPRPFSKQSFKAIRAASSVTIRTDSTTAPPKVEIISPITHATPMRAAGEHVASPLSPTSRRAPLHPVNGLVSATTAQGTISQRRRTPSSADAHRKTQGRRPSTAGVGFLVQDEQAPSISLLNPGQNSPTRTVCRDLPHRLTSSASQPVVLRRPSLAGLVCDEPVSLESMSRRLRAQSQPGKRTALFPFLFRESPPLPQANLPPPTVAPAYSHPLGNNGFTSHSSTFNFLESALPLVSCESTVLKPAGATPAPCLGNLSPSITGASLENGGDAHQNLTMRRLYPHTSLTARTPNCQTSQTATASGVTYGIQPYPHASTKTGLIGEEATSVSAAGALRPYPTTLTRRPFHLMQQIRTSILTGGYVSARLFVPKQMWSQSSVKLHGLETKIKLMERLILGLELIEKDGGDLVLPKVRSDHGGDDGCKGILDPDFLPGSCGQTTTTRAGVLNSTERFLKRLDAFEELLESLQSGVAKKLGLGSASSGQDHPAYGQGAKKSGGLGTLVAQKLGKGIDRITHSKSSSDLSVVYVEMIAKLFEKSQVVDLHLACLEELLKLYCNLGLSQLPKSVNGKNCKELTEEVTGSHARRRAGLYCFVGRQMRAQIEGRLKKISEFYSAVVCRFVVADMGLLLDKFVKRGGAWLGD